MAIPPWRTSERIGDDFFIEVDQGRRAFKVDGKALRVRSTLKFEDANGRELYKISEKLARVRDSVTIEHSDGAGAAKHRSARVPDRAGSHHRCHGLEEVVPRP